jgi:hypothetical protein
MRLSAISHLKPDTRAAFAFLPLSSAAEGSLNDMSDTERRNRRTRWQPVRVVVEVDVYQIGSAKMRAYVELMPSIRLEISPTVRRYLEISQGVGSI